MNVPKKIHYVDTSGDEAYIRVEEYDINSNCEECDRQGGYIDRQEKYEVPLCINCLKNQPSCLREQVFCNNCEKIVFDCNCSMKVCHKLEPVIRSIAKEKPISESQWIRARDYA